MWIKKWIPPHPAWIDLLKMDPVWQRHDHDTCRRWNASAQTCWHSIYLHSAYGSRHGVCNQRSEGAVEVHTISSSSTMKHKENISGKWPLNKMSILFTLSLKKTSKLLDSTWQFSGHSQQEWMPPTKSTHVPWKTVTTAPWLIERMDTHCCKTGDNEVKTDSQIRGFLLNFHHATELNELEFCRLLFIACKLLNTSKLFFKF